MKPIALVIPWYGDDIQGGAEKECNTLAHILVENGVQVEVFTSCVKDASCDRGKNTLAPGLYVESGINVRRFLVKESRDIKAYTKANQKIYEGNYSLGDEEIYFKEDINSPDLYKYIKKNQDNYHAFVFIPYMYGITFNCSDACQDNSILIPCLHDESYAYMRLLKDKMPRFKGIIFHAKPELELALKLYEIDINKVAVLGEGVETDWSKKCCAEHFRKKYNIHDDFILYAGRKDLGKKVDELINFFIRFKQEYKLMKIKLVTLGGGKLPLEIPDEYKNDIIDLGFVSIEDKHDAFAAATFFCNPSYYESFSIVIMESWLARRPVLVSEHCAVTTNFCLESKGGLYYNDYFEFAECLDYLLKNSNEANIMGENGFKYVMENFSYDIIAKKYIDFIKEKVK